MGDPICRILVTGTREGGPGLGSSVEFSAILTINVSIN
jgi:hypothetical protein